MIGVLSDAHGNFEIFRRMLDGLTCLGADRFVFLGDAVGYIPSADVVSALMEMGDRVQCILGNHEQMMLSGQYPEHRELVYRLQATRGLLTQEQLAFVAGWPTHIECEYQCGRSLFVHGSPVDYQNGYVYPDSDLSRFDGAYEFVFMGHTHRAFVREHGARTFVNVGSCGLPRDDGRYASAALFDPLSGHTTLVRLKLSFFDVESFFARRDVHHSVTELFKRRLTDISGEIIEFN
jgi:predicted phosphodiesterase